MTVSDLLQRTTSLELTEWRAYYTVEPFGPERDDIRAAIIAQTVYNAIGPLVAGKRFRPESLDQFVPKFRLDDRPIELSPEETRIALLRGLGMV